MDILLIMFKEDGEGKEFPIESGKTIIGRQEECDLRIPLSEVSRRHAVMTVDDKVVTLRDLGSSNGTYINNERIAEQKLSAGDHIVIGPVVFTVRIDGEPVDVRPARTRLETRKPVAAAGAADEDSDILAPDDLFADDDDDDPISELEALTGTDDTRAFDLEDSDFDLDEPES